jgi:hypothetical protein
MPGFVRDADVANRQILGADEESFGGHPMHDALNGDSGQQLEGDGDERVPDVEESWQGSAMPGHAAREAVTGDHDRPHERKTSKSSDMPVTAPGVHNTRARPAIPRPAISGKQDNREVIAATRHQDVRKSNIVIIVLLFSLILWISYGLQTANKSTNRAKQASKEDGTIEGLRQELRKAKTREVEKDGTIERLRRELREAQTREAEIEEKDGTIDSLRRELHDMNKSLRRAQTDISQKLSESNDKERRASSSTFDASDSPDKERQNKENGDLDANGAYFEDLGSMIHYAAQGVSSAIGSGLACFFVIWLTQG